MKKQYQFGHTIIEIHLPEEMMIPANMGKFQVQAEQVDKVYYLEFAENLVQFVQNFQEKNSDIKSIMRKNMQILVAKDKECRLVRFESALSPYAVCVEEGPDLTRVWVNREVEQMMQYDTVFSSVLGLEKVVLRKEQLILHSAYMCRDGKAVLFSAPSETGKSTQANLWEKYRGTRTINGDRSLLVKEADGWYAHGWAICGSSEICHNEAYPIQTIVMLHQAKENEIQRLGVLDAVKKLMSQITINMWNSEFQMQALDLIQDIVMNVPVYELGCNISEDAVKCLEQVL